MTFLWPDLLWLLLLAALPLALRAWLNRSRRADGDALRGLARMHTGSPARKRARQRLPLLLMVLALLAMLFSVARPTARMSLPTANEIVVLAIDVSGSMAADDIQPTRLEAAQRAAHSFVASLPSNTRVSIVSFASSASVVLPPTRDRVDIERAIDQLQTQPGTAVGSAILMGLKALYPDIVIDMRTRSPRVLSAEDTREPRARERGSALDGDADDLRPAVPESMAVEPGSAQWAAIVLLTDGQTNAGSDPIESARIAAALGVRVFPVGFGTAEGMVLKRDGWSMRVRLDQETLQEVADITLGELYLADDALDLRQVYDELSLRLTVETREVEITGLVSALALILLLISAGLSLRWFNRAV
ncbi:MAG: VWA domain-containing protein [Burkholderiaceae bacterium]